MRKLALAALVALSGCTTTRYVTVGCVTPEQLAERKSAEPEKVSDKLTGVAAEDSRTLAANAIRLRSWGRGNLSILEQCVSARLP